MNFQRTKWFAFSSILILFLLLSRIFYLQTEQRAILANGAIESQAVDIPLNIARGNIFDRNGRCLTKNNNACTAVIFPIELADKEQTANAVAKLSQINLQEVKDRINKGTMCYFTLKISKEKAQKDNALKNVHLFEGYSRYSPDNLACHLIGYLDNTQNGAFGIEKTFDTYLKDAKTSHVRFLTDAGRYKPFDNSQTFTSTGEDKGIALTMDYHIQKSAETALESRGLKGAVLITDAINANILALASSPKFNQEQVASYVLGKGGELVDRTAMAYEPGSIFKLVLTATALENGFNPNELHFNCTGSQKVGDISISCHKKDGHGEQNLTRALANSCNPAFIQLGEMLGAESITSMALKLGFSKPIYVHGGNSSSMGNIPIKQNYLPAEIANMSIGQGEILATPLQVASLIDTIASGGKKRIFNVVDGITNGNGEVVRTLSFYNEQQVLAPSTAKELAQMMHEVTANGTASNGNLEALGGVAAKTGTAQSGWLAPDGTLMTHAWFAGFFPYEKPRYCITVFIENGKQGNNVAGAVFREIAEKIY